MLIRSCKTQSLIFFDETQKHARLISATSSTQLSLMRWNHKLVQVKTCADISFLQ